MIIAVAFLVVVLLVMVYVATTYNGLVTLRNRVKEAWSDIEVQMKRRYDLIPNLVETVKGYASHEKETLDNVIKARNMAMTGPQDIESIAKNENVLSGTLKSLFALKEAYPDLKANQNFLKLQDELRDTEDRIQAARRFYNGNVMSLNTKIEHFPSNIIAGMFGFVKEKFFELAEGEAAARQAVQVKF
ncbi:LemA protein [Elusimicrobium simillimum]|uniref:LemA family protein n=1 Tax=Elusimicrobium simillimum TaxID=3143438 RepID=UPI003C6F9E87